MAQLTIESFGYDHGAPPDGAAYVVDVRDIPASSVDGLWQLDGRDKAVQEAVMATAPAKRHLVAFLDKLPELADGDLVAFGCAEGIHRSVALAVVAAEEARARGWDVTVRHRDLGRRDTASSIETMEIRNSAGPVAEVYLYDAIGADAWGEGVTARSFVDQLDKITAPDIALRINSPGGSVFDAQAMHTALLRHPARVTAYIDGLAASAATFVALAADKVVMAPQALWMIHNPMGGVSGTAADMRQMADVLDKVRETIVGHYAAKTGLPEAQLVKAMDRETWYTATEALGAGFVDQIGKELTATAELDLDVLNRMGYRNVPEVLNAGRVLSQRNMDKIAAARDHLVEVLTDATDQTTDEAGAAESVAGGAPEPSSTLTPVPVEAFVPGVGFHRF